jgi:hypothetical protein
MDPMERAASGPVLAYPPPEGRRQVGPASGSDLHRLLARHGLVLERTVRAATGQVVQRLVENATGRPPDSVPADLASDLAGLVGNHGNHTVRARA